MITQPEPSYSYFEEERDGRPLFWVDISSDEGDYCGAAISHAATKKTALRRAIKKLQKIIADLEKEAIRIA